MKLFTRLSLSQFILDIRSIKILNRGVSISFAFFERTSFFDNLLLLLRFETFRLSFTFAFLFSLLVCSFLGFSLSFLLSNIVKNLIEIFFFRL